MSTTKTIRGVTGRLPIAFAIRTDDPTTWQAKDGSVVFNNGMTVAIEVKDGHIPWTKGPHGLNVTYCVLKDARWLATNIVADVAMIKCVDGRVFEVNDIATGVIVIPTPAMAANKDRLPETS